MPRPAAAETRWADAITGFGAHLIAEERSGHTQRNYREDILAFTSWFVGKYREWPKLADLVPSELREWKEELREARKLEPATVNRKLAALRSFLGWARDTGRMEEIQTPKSIRQVRPAPKWLDRRQQNALLRAAAKSGSPRDAAIVALLLHTGLRVAELQALRWADVDVRERKGELVVRKGKGRKQRTVPVNAEARAALAELKALRRDKKAPEVLHGQRGPMTVRGIQATIEKVAAAARLEDLTAHVLRHTFCKNLADKGVRLEMIAALAGHESLETTRRYVEPGQEDLAAAVERLAGGED